MSQSEIVTEVVYAIFNGEISLDNPQTTIKEVKSFIRKLKKGDS